MARPKPPSNPEQLLELPWPQYGLSVVDEFILQPPFTTPVGVNVRTVEPLTRRARGGSRPGLSKYINATVNGTALIQELAIVSYYDPNAQGINEADGGETSTDRVFEKPGATVNWAQFPSFKLLALANDSVVNDPSNNGDKQRVPPAGRRIRTGGSGWMPNLGGFVLNKPPTISSVSPNTGNRLGGQPITITGTYLSTPGTTPTVLINGSPATVLAQTPTSLTVQTPANAVGTYAITVTTPGGSGSLLGGFTYNAVPVITSVGVGIISVNGGSPFTIFGIDLAGTTGVTIGGVSATITATTVNSVTVTPGSRNAMTGADVGLTTAGGSALLSGAVTIGLFGEYPIPLPMGFTTGYFTGTLQSGSGLPGDLATVLIDRSLDGSTPYDSATMVLTRDPTEDPGFTLPAGSSITGVTLLGQGNPTPGVPLGDFKIET